MGYCWIPAKKNPWFSLQGRVYPSSAQFPPWSSKATSRWRKASKSSVFILFQHYPWTIKWRHQSIKACNYHIRALRHVCRGLTLESVKLIALGLVTSRLDYCNSLLYGTSKSNLNKLQRVQSDFARVVLQAAWNSSSGPLLKQLHWLPVQQRIIFKVALITFNVKSSQQPSYLHSLLDNYTLSRNLRSEGQHLLRIPLLRSAAARRSFCFGAPTVWNSLISKTREANSLESFKTRLKTELFSSAFQWSICSSTHSPLHQNHPRTIYLLFLGENLQVNLTV